MGRTGHTGPGSPQGSTVGGVGARQGAGLEGLLSAGMLVGVRGGVCVAAVSLQAPHQGGSTPTGGRGGT